MKRLLPLFASLLLCACQPPSPAKESLLVTIEKGPLAFVQDGRISREDLLLKLGTPTAQFENGRILTYNLFYQPTTGVSIAPVPVYEDHIAGSLVLVFNTQNILQRHNFIPTEKTLPSSPTPTITQINN